MRYARVPCVRAADNDIGTEGAASLATALEKNTTLTSLNFDCEPRAHRAATAARTTPLHAASRTCARVRRSTPAPSLHPCVRTRET